MTPRNSTEGDTPETHVVSIRTVCVLRKFDDIEGARVHLSLLELAVVVMFYVYQIPGFPKFLFELIVRFEGSVLPPPIWVGSQNSGNTMLY